MSARKPFLVTVVTIIVIAALGATWWGVSRSLTNSADAVGRNEIAANGTVQGTLYPGNPVSEAKLVSKEAERLNYVRAITSAARWRVDGLSGPYRLQTGASTTLVFPARKKAYTLADLRAAAPDTFIKESDGSYLLKENVAVLAGATLSFASHKGTQIRLESDSTRFVSVVSLGGSLIFKGTSGHRATVSSWDTEEATPDTTTTDGRAYIRAIGGTASFSNTDFSDLGFWSGDTGGVALTGTDDATSSSTASSQNPKVGSHLRGARLLPDKEVNTLATSAASEYGTISAKIHNVTMQGNAYGLFLTNAKHVVVSDSTISKSLIDGVAIHRNVQDVQITRTESSNNYVDGFSLDRSSTRVRYTHVTATNNGRNGLSIDGRALADGPNAVGTGTSTYGNNTVTGSTVTNNGRYGIEISGGENMSVTSSTFAQNSVGIVIDHDAKNISVDSNSFTGAALQAIAVRDGDTNTSVTNNTIIGAVTGIYVRAASATLRGNTLKAISNHGIALVGAVRGTQVSHNNIAGYGAKAIWSDTATGGRIGENDSDNWRQAMSVTRVVHSVFQPLTFVWLLLAVLLIASAFTRKRHLRVRAIRSPYPEHVPLTSLSKGMIVPTKVPEHELREDAL